MLWTKMYKSFCYKRRFDLSHEAIVSYAPCYVTKWKYDILEGFTLEIHEVIQKHWILHFVSISRYHYLSESTNQMI